MKHLLWSVNSKHKLMGSLEFALMIVLMLCGYFSPSPIISFCLYFSAIVSIVSIVFDFWVCSDHSLDDNKLAYDLRIRILVPHALNLTIPIKIVTLFYAIYIVGWWFSGYPLISTIWLVRSYFEARIRQAAKERVDLKVLFETLNQALDQELKKVKNVHNENRSG